MSLSPVLTGFHASPEGGLLPLAAKPLSTGASPLKESCPLTQGRAELTNKSAAGQPLVSPKALAPESVAQSLTLHGAQLTLSMS